MRFGLQVFLLLLVVVGGAMVATFVFNVPPMIIFGVAMALSLAGQLIISRQNRKR